MTKRTSAPAFAVQRSSQANRNRCRLLIGLLTFSLAAIFYFACSTSSSDSQGADAGAIEAVSRARYQQYFEGNRKPPPVLTLPRAALYGEPDSFGLLADLAVVDHRVIVLDSLSVLGVALIDRRDGSITLPHKLGGTVASVTNPTAIAPGDGTTVWLYFSRSGEWTSFDVEALEASPSRAVELPKGLSQPIRIGYRIVANGLFAGELLRIYDMHDEAAVLVTARGATPFPAIKPDLAIHLNRTQLAVRPRGDRLVLAFRYLSRLHVFDAQGDLERGLAGPEEVELRYGVTYDSREGIDRFVRTDDTRLAYLDVAASDDLIFGLFSGRRRGDSPDTASHGNEIHLFRWDGRFVGVWRLEEDVYRIDVDPTTGMLLGIRELPFPAVVEFSLEPLGGVNATE